MYRLAPTPSGFLHLGNAFSFILTQRLAEREGKPILLRIDDLDADRKRIEYVEDIFDTLDFLGISWHVGPRNVHEFESHWSQRYRLPLYEKALETAMNSGLVFGCRCSRKDFSGAYPGTCEKLKLAFDQPEVAWRWKIIAPCPVHVPIDKFQRKTLDLAESTGSFVVRRKDGMPAYQIAALVDDMHFGVTAVVRGVDLLPSTAAQLLVADALGYDNFCKMDFLHHELITDESGIKLSKSDGALSVRQLRQSGISREDLIGLLQPWLSRFEG